MKKLIEYFRHDYKARTDPKLIKLRIKKKYEAIGIYWSIIEMLYEAGGFFPLEDLYIMADDLSLKEEKLLDIIHFDELFTFVNNAKEYVDKPEAVYFTNERVLAELMEREVKSKNAKNAAAKSWQSRREANAMQTHEDGNASNRIEEDNNSKSKDNKVNLKDEGLDICVNNFREFCVPPMPDIKRLNFDRIGALLSLFSDFPRSTVYGAFERAGKSDFLTGKKTDFVANFDFLIKKANFIKLIEGNYDNKTNNSRNPNNDYNEE